MTEGEVCTICADEGDESQKVRLECGHCFHVECCVQWFRYHHTSCPNCRDTAVCCTAIVSSQQRVRSLIGKKASVPGVVRRRIGVYQRCKARMQELKSSLDEYCKEHRHVFKGLRALRRKVHVQAERCDDMHEVLARTPC